MKFNDENPAFSGISGNQFPTNMKNMPIYSKDFENLKLFVHPYNRDQHLKIMHKWAGKSYSSRFWLMKMPFWDFEKYYMDLFKAGRCFTLLLSLKSTLIAQVDICPFYHSALSIPIPAKEDDYSVNLIMAPYKDLISILGNQATGLSEKVLHTVLEMLFYVSNATSVYAQSDSQNTHACRLAEKVGFSLLKEVELSVKRIRLYQITKSALISRHEAPGWLTNAQRKK